jgi:hypothetical protein
MIILSTGKALIHFNKLYSVSISLQAISLVSYHVLWETSDYRTLMSIDIPLRPLFQKLPLAL